MLIEIFNDHVYDETPHGVGAASKHVPKIIISERGDIKLRDMYLKAREFLTVALDNPYYAIKTGGSYMLEIEVDKEKEVSASISAGNMMRKIPEKTFTYKFNSLRDTLDSDKNITVHGHIVIDDQLNVVSYYRDRIAEPITEYTTVISERMITDSTSTSGKRYVYDEENIGGSSNPFVDRCQQKESSDKSEDAGSVTTEEDSENPVELSENSFSVRRGLINVVHPELEIGSVEGSSFNIDAEKQKRQDEFLKNMSEKISRRHRNLQNPK